MNLVIRERVKVDLHGAVTVTDSRLHPGDEVEVIVRPIDRPASSFLKAARMVSIDAPSDYSTSFEDVLRP